jgi:hypothetical protein
MSMSQIGPNLYACGDGGQVYQREAIGTWKILDHGLLDKQLDARWILDFMANPNLFNDPGRNKEFDKNLSASASLTLLSIVGLLEEDIYVCGGRGNLESAILHWDGRDFSSLLPPRLDPGAYTPSLSHLLIESHDRVWACGQQGALLMGNARDGFTQDPAATRDILYYKMAMFREKLHIAGNDGIYRHDGEALTPLRIGIERRDRGAHTIEEAGGVLWAVSPKDILRFDGSTWERIAWPDND